MDAIVELEDAESIRRRRGYVDIPWFFLMYFTCNCWSICFKSVVQESSNFLGKINMFNYRRIVSSLNASH